MFHRNDPNNLDKIFYLDNVLFYLIGVIAKKRQVQNGKKKNCRK